MQHIDDEIRQTPAKLRKTGHRGFSLKYPADLATSLGFTGGESFEMYINHRGELLARPIAKIPGGKE